MNLVDSSAWLAYFAGESTAKYFADAIEDAEALLVPSVCLYEVFKVVLRERGEDAAFAAIAAMERGEVVDLDSELAMEAAAVGLEENLAFADSVIYAAARRRGATLWTQDEHFRGKPGGDVQGQTKIDLMEDAYSERRAVAPHVVEMNCKSKPKTTKINKSLPKLYRLSFHCKNQTDQT